MFCPWGFTRFDSATLGPEPPFNNALQVVGIANQFTRATVSAIAP